MNILLRVISRISQNSRIQLSFYSIGTLDYKSMFVRIDKLVIKEFSPLSMEEFSVTMREERASG